MILLAGGTGTLGRRVAERLTDRGDQVRVLTRDARRGEHLPRTVELVVGDLRTDPVDQLVEGASVVISAIHGFAGPTRTRPEAVDRDANARLVAAAKRAGVGHFVLVSAIGAAPDHPMSLHRMKYAAERNLLDSGISATIVRSTSFLETWTGIIGAKLAAGGPALVLGPGQNPINFVSADDLAAFVCLAAEGDPRTARQLSVGGPENLTFSQIAEHLLASSNGSGIRHVPLPVLRAMSVLARPIHPAFARQSQAAVVMNTTEMTFDAAPLRRRFPEIESTTLDMVTQRVGSQTR